MTTPDVLLENHTLLVRDGRILDLLPSVEAARRYVAGVHIDRSAHLLMPGLVDASTRLVPNDERAADPQRVGDAALLALATMLRAGTTCFCSTGYFPDVSARVATAQGMRALIGIPIAATPSAWAASAADYLTRALDFRDEYGGHPTVTTAFAPLGATLISDSTFGRIAMLANELEAGILLSLHESHAEIRDCVTQHGLRPIERLQALGLLTPALTVAHLVQVSDADVALARHGGIGVTLCPEFDLRAGYGAPPFKTWAGSALRLSLGTGTGVDAEGATADLWREMRLLTLLSQCGGGEARLMAADALAMSTCGGAAVLGLDAEIGTLESGKWADLCCVALNGPAMLTAAPPHAARLVFGCGRDAVSDVWVAGRQLLNGGIFTRLDWPALAARLGTAPDSINGKKS